MNLEHIHYLFSDFIEVYENPCNLNTVERFKVGTEIKTVTNNQSFDLKKISKQDLEETILKNIIKNSEIKLIEYFPRNIFQKIFKKKQDLKFLSECRNLIINSKTKTELNAGNILNKEIPKDFIVQIFECTLYWKDLNEYIEIYFDKSKFKVWRLY